LLANLVPIYWIQRLGELFTAMAAAIAVMTALVVTLLGIHFARQRAARERQEVDARRPPPSSPHRA
jgi:hypothetical protein